jgi:hypothetical protein
VASWFSTQWHKIPSSVQTIKELNEVLRAREELELQTIEGRMREALVDSNMSFTSSENFIDAVVCSHEFTDHCHRKTLEEINPEVPCLATSKAAELIRSWKHFDRVLDVPAFGVVSDWRKTSISALPSWLGIARLVTESDALYYHSAIAIFFKDLTSTNPEGAEAVIYTPHGIQANDLRCIPEAVPPVQTLALLHGLHDVSITLFKQLNLGALNAIKCRQVLGLCRYWISTHDEIKLGGGILTPFLRRKVYTLKEALRAQGMDREVAGTKYAELASGESITLMTS